MPLRHVKLDRPVIEHLTLDMIRTVNNPRRAGAICIFDDIDCDMPAFLAKKMNEIVMNGRDHTNSGQDIDVIVTNHALNDYMKTK